MNRVNIKLITIIFIIVTIISYNLLSTFPNKDINSEIGIENKTVEEVVEVEDINSTPILERSIHNLQNSITISLIIIFIGICHQFLVLNSEIKHYIFSALILAGFNNSRVKFPSLIINDEIQLRVTGIKKIKIIITGPFYDNYQEFGLQKGIDKNILSSRAISEIELLPLKLLLFKEYILENNK